MKKTLAVLLTICMMFAFVPFFAFAEETVELTQDNLPANYALLSDTDYVIKSGTTVVIPFGKTLQIPGSCTLTIEEGGTLDIQGTCTVIEAGKLVVKGNITNPEKVTLNQGGEAVAVIKFPALESCGLLGRINVSYAFSYTGSAYDDLNAEGLSYTPVPETGAEIEAPLNQYIYIIAHIIEPIADRDKFDDAYMKVFIGDADGGSKYEIPYTQTNHHFAVTRAGTISYSQWTNDDDFLKTYKISLPNKEGVTVYGREGEVGATDQAVYLKYGQSFSFRVEIDPAYDKSPYQVYIVKGYGAGELDTSAILADVAPAEPDADGYYTISPVEGNYTVFVMGVIENATVEKVGGIFEQVKSIFEMIKKFFGQFLAMFGISI